MNEQDAQRQKILDRINKCLKLSKSSEPHEAAAAMRQAQKLMEAHSVSDAEILGVEVKSVLVISPSPYRRKVPLHHSKLTAIVARAFGVQVIIESALVKGRSRLAYRYFGIGGKADLAAYAHEVIFRQLWASWNAYRKDRPWVNNERGARMGYWVGWLDEVRGKIDAFAGNKEEYDLVRLAINTKYGGALAKSNRNDMKLNGTTHGAGRAAAADFSIHRPMNGAKGKQLRIGSDS